MMEVMMLFQSLLQDVGIEKFDSAEMDIGDKSHPGRPAAMDSGEVREGVETNLVTSTRRLSAVSWFTLVTADNL